MKNSPLSQSVRQRLLNLSRGRGEDFQLTLVHFAIERLLYGLGSVRNGEHYVAGHIHSNDFGLIVGDGFDGPKVLARHGSNKHLQQTHTHPRFSPDGSYVVYTSDVSGYGNIYRVALADFDGLPDAQD